MVIIIYLFVKGLIFSVSPCMWMISEGRKKALVSWLFLRAELNENHIDIIMSLLILTGDYEHDVCIIYLRK